MNTRHLVAVFVEVGEHQATRAVGFICSREGWMASVPFFGAKLAALESFPVAPDIEAVAHFWFRDPDYFR